MPPSLAKRWHEKQLPAAKSARPRSKSRPVNGAAVALSKSATAHFLTNGRGGWLLTTWASGGASIIDFSAVNSSGVSVATAVPAWAQSGGVRDPRVAGLFLLWLPVVLACFTALELVLWEKRGLWVYYAPNTERLSQVAALVEALRPKATAE